jgi:3-oxoacyl-[acyl-carrier-protein] synthase II
MRNAIRMADVSPDRIGYVSAHATSTEVGDAAEIEGIKAVFGDRGKDLSVSAVKSSTGHLLGAAGALAAIFTVQAIRNGMLPATLNLDDPEPVAAVFDLVPKVAHAKDLDYALVNAFGFGGVNASLVLGKAPA